MVLRSAVLALLLSATYANAQVHDPRVQKARQVVFYGLDFSFLKLIHADGFVDRNGHDLCNTLPFKYFTEWNEMFLIEPDKFSVKRYFGIPDQLNDLEVVNERNRSYAFTEGCIIADPDYKVARADIEIALDNIGRNTEGGLGLVIFVESMNKVDGKCRMQVVFFDRSDGSVIGMEGVVGTPSGIGFRNFWINAIDNALATGASRYSKARKAAK